MVEVELQSVIKQSVFDKILTIPMTSLNMIDFGLISNIITSDLQSIIHYVYFLIVGYSSLLFMIPALAIIYYHYEWYFLFAPFWIVVLMLVNAVFTHIATIFMIKRTKYSDNLGVLANEIVKGIKNIKFNVWEKISLKKTMHERRGDGKMNSWYMLLTQNINNLSYFVPTLIVASIHIVFLRQGKSFTLSEVYFLISICSSLILPSINLTEFVIYGAKQKVSIARLANFMNIESKKNISNDVELEVGELNLKNYTASWIDPE